MKKLIYLLILCLFTGCTPQTVTKDELKIIIATDIHYISDQLNDKGGFFKEMMRTADGKMSLYSTEITQAFLDQVIIESPDILLISGDITFNGAKVSHLDFIKMLQPVKDQGIDIYVIPGNHDVNSRNAAQFIGDSYLSVESISNNEFEHLYQDFGYQQALSNDPSSASYLVSLNDDINLLAIDTNCEDHTGILMKSTYQWIQEAIKMTHQQNKKLLTMTHQNLLQHNDVFTYGFQITDPDELINTLKQTNHLINLSGHMHTQHIENDDDLVDIATSSLAIYPHQYGIIELTPTSLNYHTTPTDVSTWAKKQNLDDPYLLNFNQNSKDEFWNTSYRKLSQNIGHDAATYFSDINSYYFQGRQDLLHENMHSQEPSIYGEFLSDYVNSILNDEAINHNIYQIKFIDE